MVNVRERDRNGFANLLGSRRCNRQHRRQHGRFAGLTERLNAKNPRHFIAARRRLEIADQRHQRRTVRRRNRGFQLFELFAIQLDCKPQQICIGRGRVVGCHERNLWNSGACDQSTYCEHIEPIDHRPGNNRGVDLLADVMKLSRPPNAGRNLFELLGNSEPSYFIR